MDLWRTLPMATESRYEACELGLGAPFSIVGHPFQGSLLEQLSSAPILIKGFLHIGQPLTTNCPCLRAWSLSWAPLGSPVTVSSLLLISYASSPCLDSLSFDNLSNISLSQSIQTTSSNECHARLAGIWLLESWPSYSKLLWSCFRLSFCHIDRSSPSPSLRGKALGSPTRIYDSSVALLVNLQKPPSHGIQSVL